MKKKIIVGMIFCMLIFTGLSSLSTADSLSSSDDNAPLDLGVFRVYSIGIIKDKYVDNHPDLGDVFVIDSLFTISIIYDVENGGLPSIVPYGNQNFVIPLDYNGIITPRFVFASYIIR